MSRWVAFAVLAVFAIACGGESGGTAASPSPSPLTTSPSSSRTPSPQALVFKLNGINTSASGTLTISATSDNVTLRTAVEGLQPNSSHVSHIHIGSCAQRGGIAFALNLVVADGQGDANTKTTFRAVYPPATGRWYVVVHAGPNMDGSNATYLLCGNLFA